MCIYYSIVNSVCVRACVYVHALYLWRACVRACSRALFIRFKVRVHIIWIIMVDFCISYLCSAAANHGFIIMCLFIHISIFGKLILIFMCMVDLEPVPGTFGAE